MPIFGQTDGNVYLYVLLQMENNPGLHIDILLSWMKYLHFLVIKEILLIVDVRLWHLPVHNIGSRVCWLTSNCCKKTSYHETVIHQLDDNSAAKLRVFLMDSNFLPLNQWIFFFCLIEAHNFIVGSSVYNEQTFSKWPRVYDRTCIKLSLTSEFSKSWCLQKK